MILGKENLTTLIHTVANVNICDRRLLMLSHLSYSKRRGSKWEKSAMHVGFWKLCMTVVHVDVTFKVLFRKYVTAVIDGHFLAKRHHTK